MSRPPATPPAKGLVQRRASSNSSAATSEIAISSFVYSSAATSEIEIAISSFVYSSAATSAIAISAESAKDVEELAESPPRLRTSAVLSAPASANASLATSAARQSAAALIGMRFPTLVRSVLSLRKRVPVGSVAPW